MDSMNELGGPQGSYPDNFVLISLLEVSPKGAHIFIVGGSVNPILGQTQSTFRYPS